MVYLELTESGSRLVQAKDEEQEQRPTPNKRERAREGLMDGWMEGGREGVYVERERNRVCYLHSAGVVVVHGADKMTVTNGFRSHADEDDDERINQMVVRAREDADWVMKKVRNTQLVRAYVRARVPPVCVRARVRACVHLAAVSARCILPVRTSCVVCVDCVYSCTHSLA